MNILENYVETIHSETPYEEEWTKKFDDAFVEVDLTSNCYGSKKRDTHVWTVSDWKSIKEKGYYMA